MSVSKTFTYSGLIAATFCSSLVATPLTGLEILQQFNVVVSGNLSTAHDIAGRTVVGGDLIHGATFNNSPGGLAPSQYRALTVYGNSTSSDTINVNNGGGVTIAGTVAGSINLNDGGGTSTNGSGTTAPDPLPDFASTFGTALSDLSDLLASFGSNSTFPSNADPEWPNNVALRASSGPGLAIFNITTGQLSQLASFYLDLNGRSGAIFNVSGTSFSQNANFQQAGANARDIIWNFTDATNLSFTQWGGTILAPNASVTNSSALEGNLFAASFSGNGEVHTQAFRQGLPAANVPEPTSVVLIGAGIAALVVLRKVR